MRHPAAELSTDEHLTCRGQIVTYSHYGRVTLIFVVQAIQAVACGAETCWNAFPDRPCLGERISLEANSDDCQECC